jgi:hypothetical protein
VFLIKFLFLENGNKISKTNDKPNPQIKEKIKKNTKSCFSVFVVSEFSKIKIDNKNKIKIKFQLQ